MNIRHCKSRMGVIQDWSKHDTAIAKERASVESFKEMLDEAKATDPPKVSHTAVLLEEPRETTLAYESGATAAALSETWGI